MDYSMMSITRLWMYEGLNNRDAPGKRTPPQTETLQTYVTV